jgi:hypothetical protein
MNKYRSAAVTLAVGAASLTLAACTAGITTAGPAVSSSSASPADAGRTIEVSNGIGSFPVPAGAKVAENIASRQETVIFFDMVTPARVSSFYAQALPRAGYTVTANSVITQSGATVALIQFTGHGVKGTIDALSKFTDPTVSIAGLGHKNVTTITFMPN